MAASEAQKAGNPFDTGSYAVPAMASEEFDRIAVSMADVPSRLRSVLEEHGCAVVTGVIPCHDELQRLEDEFRADLLDLVDADAVAAAPKGVRRAYQRFVEEGPASFPLETVASHLTEAAGFVLARCLAHGRFAWSIRRHENVHTVFQQLFPGEGDKLVTSLDVTMFTPRGQSAQETNGFSAHVDQNLHDVRSELAKCNTYQGVLYVWPACKDGGSSTTVVWPGSHRSVWPHMMRDRAFKTLGTAGQHYCPIQDMQNRSRARAFATGWAEHARRVTVPAGGLLLWNSRTMHTGWKGGPRLAQAVCLEPVTRRPERERLAKLRLAALGLPACHWASAGMQHDMSLGRPGCFNHSKVEAADDPSGKGDLDAVVLPLRPALWPAALHERADLERLVELVNVEYRHCGMWKAPENLIDLLEASVREDFKEFL